jgi:ATP-dependent Clp protease ATP-binding subunit ClpX
MRILVEPKNAIVKQYQKFFALDKVELDFEEDALEAAADMAITQKTGARGLRTIIEDVLLDVMYEIPSRADVKRCVVTSDVIRSRGAPVLELRTSAERVAIPEEKSA